jgi:hypothetical protein
MFGRPKLGTIPRTGKRKLDSYRELISELKKKKPFLQMAYFPVFGSCPHVARYR